MIMVTHQITSVRPAAGAQPQSTPYATAHPVQIVFAAPAKQAEARAMGAEIKPQLYDDITQAGQYQLNDIITIVASRSGYLPTVTQYQCGLPDVADGLLPRVTVELTGYGALYGNATS